MRKALEECNTYNRMGGLDDTMMKDIAFDFDVDFEELKKAFEE